MKIALIWSAVYSCHTTLPTCYGYLYNAIKNDGHIIRLFNLPLEGWGGTDKRFLDAISDFNPDIAGFSAWAQVMDSTVETARAVRNRLPATTMILGGGYATIATRLARQNGLFDYVFSGETQLAFPRFLRCIERGDLAALDSIPGIHFINSADHEILNPPHYVVDLDDLGEIDWDFIELNRAINRGYQRTFIGPKKRAPVTVSRGCPNNCAFCASPITDGEVWRHHSIPYLLRQINKLYDDFGIRQINFMDDNPTNDMDFFKELCREIIKLELPDLTFAIHRGLRLDRIDPELCKLMKEAGFNRIIIAPESGSDRIRSMMGKNYTVTQIYNAAEMIREAGLKLHGFFIVGFPGESKKERKSTYLMISDLNFDYVKVFKFLANPGSAIFNRLVSEDRIPEDYNPNCYILGDHLPNYNDDSSDKLDRELACLYFRFYSKAPRKLVELIRISRPWSIWKVLSGLIKGSLGISNEQKSVATSSCE